MRTEIPVAREISTRPIRLAFCIHGMDTGGTELNAVRTAERLVSQGYHVQVAAWNASGPLRGRYDDAGIPVEEFALSSFRSASTLREGVRLFRWLRSEDVDIVHAHDIYSNIFGVPWARLAGVPVVVASRRWGTARRTVHNIANRKANRLAHLVLANSTRGAARLREEGVCPARIRVVPNYLEEEAFEPFRDDERVRLRQELELPTDALVIGIVANLNAWKDHRTLVQAFAMLAREHPAWYLVAIGEGPERHAIEALSHQLGLARRVKLPGHRPNRPNLHGLFDISTLVSPDEGSPNSVLEALAAGRPVVASNVGGIPELVEDGINGILVQPANPDLLGDALRRLMSDGELRQTMGDAGRARARRLHSAEAVLGQLAGLYHEALELRLGSAYLTHPVLHA